jgi:malonate transporter
MTTITIIFPIIFVVFMGYACARSQFLERTQIDGLSKLTFSLIMPVFLFINMATANMAGVFDLAVLTSFYMPVALMYGLSLAYQYFFGANNPRQLAPASVFALGASYSNLVLVGMPITIAALGEQVIGPVFVLISFHGVVLFGSTIIICALSTDDGKKFSWLNTLRNVTRNPVVGSIWLGLIVNFTGLPLPELLVSSLQFFSKSGIPLALFVLGTALHFYSVYGKVGQIAAVTVIKLVISPFLVWWLAFKVFEIPHDLATMTVLLACSPTGINAYLIATQQKCHEALIASTVVVSTVLCMFSFSFWLAVLL